MNLPTPRTLFLAIDLRHVQLESRPHHRPRAGATGWESEPVRLILTPDGGAEQSPDDWWRAFQARRRPACWDVSWPRGMRRCAAVLLHPGRGYARGEARTANP